MTIHDFIKQKFKTFGIRLSEADLLDIWMNDSELNEDNKDSVIAEIGLFIPSLLLHPKSIKESGFSISWDIDGIKAYYSYICKRYGIEDLLNNDAKVRFIQ